MIKTYKAGLIGSGFAARFHLEAIKRVYSTSVEVTGVFSRSATKLDSFVAAYGIKKYDTLDALIDASDMLHVCTPPSTHEELVIAVLKKGKHVIVEKPFTGYFGDGTPGFNGDK